MKIKVVILSVFVGLSFLLTSCFLIKNDDLDKITTNMISAYISQDEDEIIALTHPDYIDKIYDIEEFFKALKQNGIVIDGEVKDLAATTREYSAYDSEYDGATTYSYYNVTIGDIKYFIKLMTLKNDNGYGIIQFDIGLK